MALSAEKVRAMGYTEMPKAGWLPTMVPGAPAGWAELNRRFGTKPLAELFAPAISYAEEGYPVPVNVARQWERDSRRIAKAMAGERRAARILVAELYEAGRHALPRGRAVPPSGLRRDAALPRRRRTARAITAAS